MILRTTIVSLTGAAALALLACGGGGDDTATNAGGLGSAEPGSAEGEGAPPPPAGTPTSPAPPLSSPSTPPPPSTPLPTAPPTGRRIVSGATHTCVLLSNGTVKCWGDNSQAQLGVGPSVTKSGTPLLVPGLTNVIGLSSGYAGRNTCAFRSDGTVWCWGSKPGVLDSPTPAPVGSLAGTVAVSFAGNATGTACAVDPTGALRCWGDLVTFSNPNYPNDVLITGSAQPTTPQPTTVTSGATDVGCASSAICIAFGTQVKCKGYGGGVYEVPVNLTAKDMAVGDFHSCFVDPNGTLGCFGDNSSNQLGYDFSPSEQDLVGVDQVSVGFGHTCVLTGGLVKCFGANAYGQLGNPARKTDPHYEFPPTMPGSLRTPKPQLAKGVTGAIAVSVGYWHSCALLPNDSVLCWGHNRYGELGQGTIDEDAHATPTAVVGLP